MLARASAWTTSSGSRTTGIPERHDALHIRAARASHGEHTARASFTATPLLTFQFTRSRSCRPDHIPTGVSSAHRARPTTTIGSRPYRTGIAPGGFNFKQFNSNAVVRWEYRPGSTLFFVWQQGRVEDTLNRGTFEFERDYRDLFRAHPVNTFLVKATYFFKSLRCSEQQHLDADHGEWGGLLPELQTIPGIRTNHGEVLV